jgi:hypothetical protein
MSRSAKAAATGRHLTVLPMDQGAGTFGMEEQRS